MVDLNRYRTIFWYRPRLAYCLTNAAILIMLLHGALFGHPKQAPGQFIVLGLLLVGIWQAHFRKYLIVFRSTILIDEGARQKSIKVEDLHGWRKMGERIALQSKKDGIHWIRLGDLRTDDQSKLMSRLVETGLPEGTFDTSLLNVSPSDSRGIRSDFFAFCLLAATLLIIYYF